MKDAGWLQEQMASPTFRRIYAREGLMLEFSEAISAVMEDRKISRAELARRMKRTPAFITQILNHDRNPTLATLARIGQALGCEFKVTTR
jgi:ribosome-binding protein aMBF1 (putative translation factor)